MVTALVNGVLIDGNGGAAKPGSTVVVDGDTIHVRIGTRVEKVRYIGVNTPEVPYEARWWQPAWIQANGLGPEAGELLEVLSQADREGLIPEEYLTPTIDSLLHRHLLPNEAWQLDTLLTAAFFRYGTASNAERRTPICRLGASARMPSTMRRRKVVRASNEPPNVPGRSTAD